MWPAKDAPKVAFPQGNEVVQLTAVCNRYADATKISVSSYEQFDALGCVMQSSQLTQGGAVTPYVFSYRYYRDGSLASIQYPSQRTR